MFERSNESGITTLKMAHGKVNAMSLEFCQSMIQHLEELRKTSCQAVILTGNERVFSAGVDLVRLVEESPQYLDTFLPTLVKMFETVFYFPKPVVAAVSGHAVAGGCVLACACDYRVIANQASIGVPELRVGVPFPVSGMEIMRWATSPQAFRQIINAGATFTGGHAVEVGLADESTEPSLLLSAGMTAVERLLTVRPAIFHLTKQQMRGPVTQLIESGRKTYGDEINRLWRDPETRNAVAAYVRDRLGKHISP